MSGVAVSNDPGPGGPSTTAEDLKRLERLAADPKTDAEQLWQKVVAFRRLHPGTVESGRAALLLARLRSPLDRLDPKRIATGDRFDWQPKGLVAVLGGQEHRHWGVLRAVQFSPDGTVIASAASDGLVLWDAATLKERARLPRVGQFAFAPDGKSLAVIEWAGTWLSTVHVYGWDGRTLTRTLDLPKKGYIARGLAFAPGGKRLAVKYDEDPKIRSDELRHIRDVYVVWDWDTGTPKQRELPRVEFCHEHSVFALGGKLLLHPGPGSELFFWDVSRKLPRLHCKMERVGTFAVSADGKTLAETHGDSITLWNLTGKKPKETANFDYDGNALRSFSPDGRTLAGLNANTSEFVLWSLDGLKAQPGAKASVPPPRWARLPFRASSLSFSPDGKRIAFGCYADASVRLWDVAQGKELFTPRGHCGPVVAKFSPGGRRLATLGADGTFRLWDLTASPPAETFVQRFGPDENLESLCFAPDGGAAACLKKSQHGSDVRVWDLTGKRLRALKPLPIPEGVEVGRIAFAPTRKRLLLVAGAKRLNPPQVDIAKELWQTTLAIWRTEAAPGTSPVASTFFMGPKVRSPNPYFYPSGLSLSPDGRRLALWSRWEFRLWDWDGTRGKELTAGRAFTEWVYQVSFAPDRAEIALCGEDQEEDEKEETHWLGRVKFWTLGGHGPLEREVQAVPKVLSVDYALGGAGLLTMADYGDCTLRDRKTGKVQWHWRSPPGRWSSIAAVAPDGRHIALGNANGTVYIVRLKEAPKR
jgi:WD40 repeat protein